MFRIGDASWAAESNPRFGSLWGVNPSQHQFAKRGKTALWWGWRDGGMVLLSENMSNLLFFQSKWVEHWGFSPNHSTCRAWQYLMLLTVSLETRHELVLSIIQKALSAVRPFQIFRLKSQISFRWSNDGDVNGNFQNSQLWEILQHILIEFDYVLIFDQWCSTRFMVAFACLFPNRKGSCWPLRTCRVVFHLASWPLLGGENQLGLEPKFIATLIATPQPPTPNPPPNAYF